MNRFCLVLFTRHHLARYYRSRMIVYSFFSSLKILRTGTPIVLLKKDDKIIFIVYVFGSCPLHGCCKRAQ